MLVLAPPAAWQEATEEERSGTDGTGRCDGNGREVVDVPEKYYLGDIVRMRKPHPCGDDRWEVMRTGMDFRIKCLGCGRVVMLPRRKFEGGVKEILKRGVDEEDA